MELQYIREMEDKFQMTINKATEKIKNSDYVNLVIGIPFYIDTKEAEKKFSTQGPARIPPNAGNGNTYLFLESGNI